MIYEYQCPEHGIFEAITKIEDRDNPCPCPKCGTLSDRIMSATRFKLEGISGDFPTAADKWADMHGKEAKRETDDEYSS